MITFDDWKIQSVGYPLAMQYDHITREMYISGDIPDGYTWDVLCRYKRELNIIRLEVVEGGISTLLTKHDLANSGTYIIQLRGTKDGTVRHSNAIQVEVPKSLSGDDQWPFVPSEFSQMEARINAIAKAADDLNNHPPIPGDNGYWLVWDTDSGAYVESDLPLPAVSVGPQGSQGEKGDKGDTGAQGHQGEKGEDGKSAYQPAQDGCYIGTEMQFNRDMADVSDKYEKPSGGIPKTDLASAVQTSLGKADSAIQQHQSLAAYRTAEVQDTIDATKQDKVTTQTITIAVADWGGRLTCTKSVTGVTTTSIVIVDTSDGNVECTGQSAGTLTFTATSTPTSAVTAKVAILAGESESGYTNQIPISKDASGNIYNVVGYKTGYRLNSSGAETAASDHAVTGFISFKLGDVIRTKGFKAINESEGIQFYNSSFVSLGGFEGSHISQESSYDATEGSFEWTPPSVIHDDGMGTDRSISTAAYIRLNMLNTTMPVSDAIVTINEEII